MHHFVTTCSREKRGEPGLLPAAERYLAHRIRRLEELSRTTGHPGLVLSSRFGLIALRTPIPWYDQALEPTAVESLAERVRRQLEARRVSALTLLALSRRTPGWEPYYRVLEQACARVGVPLEVLDPGVASHCDPLQPESEMAMRRQQLNHCVLFDWGDTLMRNLPGVAGPMATWPRIEVMPGATRALTVLRPAARLAVATNARDSGELAVWEALARGGLERLVDTVYCFQRTGCRKPDPDFFRFVLDDLGLGPEKVWLIGDDLDGDITGALAAGIRAVWLNHHGSAVPAAVSAVPDLGEAPAALRQLGLPVS